MILAARRTCRIAGAGASAAILLFSLMLACSTDAAAQPATGAGSLERSVAADTARQPFHAVRTLAMLQERIAQGDEMAFAMQRDVVQEIADELKAFPQAVWRTQRNREALVKYALSGGDPAQLRLVLSQKLFPPAELPLAEGALAYAEGQRTKALRHLERIDLLTLPPSLAGHVALVKALVLANTDVPRVMRLADEARLLSPGTLVEETALRLAMEGAIARADRAKFEAYSYRYFRRYPRSPYMNAVIRPAAAAMVEHGLGEKPEGVNFAREVVHFLDPLKLVQFYAAFAEMGLNSGKLATTVNAARLARKYARRGSTEYAWTEAYEGAALAIGLAPEEGLALLNSAEASGVTPPIGELIASARAISHLIRSPPVAASMAAATSTKPAAGSKAADDVRVLVPADQNPTAGKVKARIAQIDKMLKDIGK